MNTALRLSFAALACALLTLPRARWSAPALSLAPLDGAPDAAACRQAPRHLKPPAAHRHHRGSRVRHDPRNVTSLGENAGSDDGNTQGGWGGHGGKDECGKDEECTTTRITKRATIHVVVIP